MYCGLAWHGVQTGLSIVRPGVNIAVRSVNPPAVLEEARQNRDSIRTKGNDAAIPFLLFALLPSDLGVS